MPWRKRVHAGRECLRGARKFRRAPANSEPTLPFLTERHQSIPGTEVTLSGICGRRNVPWQQCHKIDERLRFADRIVCRVTSLTARRLPPLGHAVLRP